MPFSPNAYYMFLRQKKSLSQKNDVSRRTFYFHKTFFFYWKNMDGKFLASSEKKLIPCCAKHTFMLWLYYSQAKRILKGKTD